MGGDLILFHMKYTAECHLTCSTKGTHIILWTRVSFSRSKVHTVFSLIFNPTKTQRVWPDMLQLIYLGCGVLLFSIFQITRDIVCHFQKAKRTESGLPFSIINCGLPNWCQCVLHPPTASSSLHKTNLVQLFEKSSCQPQPTTV